MDADAMGDLLGMLDVLDSNSCLIHSSSWDVDGEDAAAVDSSDGRS
jgi:hypothetical protein